MMRPRPLVAVALVAASLFGLVTVGPAGVASAATCASASKSIGGVFSGEDGRRLSGLVGIGIFDSAGTPINRFGCPVGPSDPPGYTFNTSVNYSGCCQPLIGAQGAEPGDTRYANTWRIDGLPSNAATVWAEAYPIDYSHYGGAMRRLVPVDLNVDVRLPQGCSSGGNNGSITGRAIRGGSPVAVKSVIAFSRADEGTGQILGFIAQPEGSTSDGAFTVRQLEPQRYALSFELADGSQYWFENDYGAGLPVAPCAATNQLFDMQGDGHAHALDPVGSGPGAAILNNGNAIAYRGGEGSVWYRQGANLTSLGGLVLGAPDLATAGTGRVDLVARGTDNAVWLRTFNGSSWGGWASLGGVVIDAPTIVSWGTNRLDVFATGLDHQLWHRWTTDGSNWFGWEPLGGVLTAGPDAASWGNGRLDIVARGTDGQVWHRYFAGQWFGWEPLGGQILGGPASAAPATNRFDIVARGTDNTVWIRSWNGAQWLPWTSLGGATPADPDAFGAQGVTTVFITGTDNNFWAITRPSLGGSFGSWAQQ
jgi:hypothetical protein